MKKVLLSLAMAVVSLAVTAQQLVPQQLRQQVPVVQKATASDATIEYGFCGELAQSLGFAKLGTYRAFLKVPVADATKYAGAQITGVKVGLGEFAKDHNAQILILKDLEGSEPIYTQAFTPTQTSWNEVALETPYTINGEEIYIGYQINSGTSPFGVDNLIANENSDIVGLEDKGSYKYLHIGSQGFGNNCIKIVLTGDKLPKYDFSVEDLTIKQYVTTGEEFSISTTVKNIASEAISSFDVAYQIGNAEPVVSTITLDEALVNSKSYTFSIDKLVVNESGMYDVTVTVSNLNGQADEYEANNSMTKAITAVSTFVPRKLLLENFSTAQCGNCPRVHEIIKEVLMDRNDVAWVVHHAGYGTDTYTIDASSKYLWFYGTGGTYAPAAMLDRRFLKEIDALGARGIVTAPVFFPDSKESLIKYINYCAEQPAFISLNITDVYNEETRELTVRVTGESSAELAVVPNINIFLTENGLTGYQSGGGNKYTHDHVVRKVMTSTWGDQLTFDNNKFDVTYTCTLDEAWKAENMSVVAFVADYNEKNYNECTVHNTEFKVLEYGAAVGKLTNDQCRVMSINKTVNFTGKYNNAAVYTIDGRLVQVANGKACITLDNAGVYIVVVDGVSHKVIVK